MGRVKRVNDAAKAAAEEIIQLLKERRQTLAVAESCTGGLIGHLLTEVPGSSEAFLGGVIVYANEIKMKVGVPKETLEQHGAVSPQTAASLATGIRKWAGADYGLAVTGIAGPSGATDSKPVGLTYVAVVAAGGVTCEEHRFKGDRSTNKLASALAALRLLSHALERGS